MGQGCNNLGTKVNPKKSLKGIVNKVRGDKVHINGQLNSYRVVLENPDPNFFLPEMYNQIKRLFNNYLSN